MSDLSTRRVVLERPVKQVRKAAEAQQRGELAIFEHGVTTRIVSECDRLDSEAVADSTRVALEEELSLLSWGMEQAGDRVAAAELVSRKVAFLADSNDARLRRRFGG